MHVHEVGCVPFTGHCALKNLVKGVISLVQKIATFSVVFEVLLPRRSKQPLVPQNLGIGSTLHMRVQGRVWVVVRTADS